MEAIGWPRETISRWKNKRGGPPGLADRRKLARGLHLPADAFDYSPREWEAALKTLRIALAGGGIGWVASDTRIALLALLGAAERNIAAARGLLLGGDSEDDVEARHGPPPSGPGDIRRASGDT
jgi:hypothetical protein